MKEILLKLFLVMESKGSGQSWGSGNATMCPLSATDEFQKSLHKSLTEPYSERACQSRGVMTISESKVLKCKEKKDAGV